jgi:hypothetical protein
MRFTVDTECRYYRFWPEADIAPRAAQPDICRVRMSIRDRFRAAFRWVRAVSLSSRGCHEEALTLVRSINVPPTGPRWEWSLFEVHQLSLLRRHAETLPNAIRLIDELTAKPTLSANGHYCVSFAKWAGAEAFQQLFPVTPTPAKLQQDFAAVRLSDVQPKWKRHFPLLIPPDWVAPPRLSVFGPRPAER